jgi:HAD superfamily hydrolase (TIGR01450 family)
MILAHTMRIPLSQPACEATPRLVAMSDLLQQHEAFLFDAYGVLVDGSGALPHAHTLIQTVQQRAIPYAIVTNDASRSPITCAARFAILGLDIPAQRIVTSGDLIAEYFAANHLTGAATIVLGTDDSRAYVVAAGGNLVPLQAGVNADVIAVCDDAGFAFLAGCEVALSAACRQLDAGRPLHLLLPNPDIIYPKSATEYGFTAGAIALLIEAALVRRFGDTAPRFVALGKPSPNLLLRGQRITGGTPLMIGDQLQTDIASANAAGLPSALLGGAGSVSQWRPDIQGPSKTQPTYLLASLSL